MQNWFRFNLLKMPMLMQEILRKCTFYILPVRNDVKLLIEAGTDCTILNRENNPLRLTSTAMKAQVQKFSGD